MTYRSHSQLPIVTLVAIGFLFAPATATAQDEDYERIVTIMRACSQIDDMVARVTCYDNNVGQSQRVVASSSPAPAPLPSPPPAVRNAVPASSPRTQPESFGAEMLPQVRAEQRESRGDDEITSTVSAARMVEPGIYLLTLADGAQWRFVDGATMAFVPPRAGDEVRLERGSLGSVFMHFDGQKGLRVRRVR